MNRAKNIVPIRVMAALFLMFTLVLGGCGTTGASATAGDSFDTFVSEAKKSEGEKDWIFALMSWSCAQATSEITSEKLDVELTRIKENLGEAKFSEYALEAADLCQVQANTAQNEADKTGDSDMATLSLLWTMAGLNLTLAAL
jgi:hypothetical protein